MAVQTAILVLFLLLSGGCGAKKYDLSVMPKYEFVITDTKYNNIDANRTVYAALNHVYSTLKEKNFTITEIHKARMIKAVDKYLYWASAANIQYYYGDYSLSDKSCEKASDALEEYRLILREIYLSKQV